MRAVFSGFVEGVNRSLVFLSRSIVSRGGNDFNWINCGR